MIILDIVIIPIMVSFCTAFRGFVLGNLVWILLGSGITTYELIKQGSKFEIIYA